MTKRSLVASTIVALIMLGTPAEFSAAQTGASPAKVLSASSGRYRVTASLGQITISDERAEEWWGLMSGSSSGPYIKSLDIQESGRHIFVPASAYYGLARPRLISVASRKGGCVVTIRGADAATGYTCTLTVKGRHVTERVVRLHEFPKDRWERTTYHYLNDKEIT